MCISSAMLVSMCLLLRWLRIPDPRMSVCAALFACSSASLVGCEDAKGDAPRGGIADGGPTASDTGTTEEGNPTRTPGTLRVATFNVRRYFDTVCQSGNCAAGSF